MAIDRDWLEFKDLKRRDYDNQVWVPLRAMQTRLREGESWDAGFREERFDALAFAVDATKVDIAKRADADDILYIAPFRPYIAEGGRYITQDTVESFFEDLRGLVLVISQRFPGDNGMEWSLNQDFVFALNLMRVDDNWVRLEEGRVEVARLRRDVAGNPVLLEARAEFLKDYLCARKMGLALGTLVHRTSVTETDPDLPWERPTAFEDDVEKRWRWRGDITETDEGGWPFDQTIEIFEMHRTDFDDQNEVPLLEIDGEVETNRWTAHPGAGPKLYHVSADLRRTEWISPGAHSPRVAQEKVASTSYFMVDAAGTKSDGDVLKSEGNLWLWFRPEIVNDAMSHPDGFLCWYTASTGELSFSADHGVHFGVNDLGLLNVLAVDVGRLAHWDQAKWAAHNVAPSGKVSVELLDAQVRAQPARTVAPETEIPVVLNRMAECVKKRYGIDLYHGLADEKLLRSVHRFRALNGDSLCGLAKDIHRIFGDRIDKGALQKAVLQSTSPQLGSLKVLERSIATLIPTPKAEALCTALFGIYDLRIGDAHPTGSDIEDAMRRANVNPTDPSVLQGTSMLIAFVFTLHEIAQVIESAPDANSA